MTHWMEALGGTCAPTHWHVRPAITGRGPILLGPDFHVEGPGALVYAPPGVLLRTADDGPPLDREGWRKARWGPDERGRVLIDQARPIASAHVSLAEVVEDVATYAPGHLGWVAHIVERRLRVLWGTMRARDHAGRLCNTIPGSSDETEAVDRMLDAPTEADAAFRRAAAIVGEGAPYLRDGHFYGLFFGGYVAHHDGTKRLARLKHGGSPLPRYSTLRPSFRDDDDERPRPRPVE